MIEYIIVVIRILIELELNYEILLIQGLTSVISVKICPI